MLPVLAKADCMTTAELEGFREHVRTALHHVSTFTLCREANPQQDINMQSQNQFVVYGCLWQSTVPVSATAFLL